MRKEKPSRTAYKVAANILTLGEKPEMEKILPSGIVDATEKLLLASGACNRTLVRWSRTRGMIHVYEAFDWMLPGQFEAFGHRKAFCEKQVRDGIEKGITQVLVLGAGYDTMGWRLAPEFVGVNFFEIDHPATAGLKAKGIEEMGKRDNLHLIQADLSTQKLVDVLNHDAFWDKTGPTAIVAEGLLMYLPVQAVCDLLVQCVSVTGTGSRLAFTYVATSEDGRPDAGKWKGLVLWTLKASGEPWLWSISPKKLDKFLSDSGWTNAPDLIGGTNKKGVEFFSVATR